MSITTLPRANQIVRIVALSLILLVGLGAADATAKNVAVRDTPDNPLVDVSERLDLVREGLGGAAWFDYNNNGLLDLFIPNSTGNPNSLFRNNGDGSFTDVASAAGVANGLGNSGVIAGDINNDGCADLYLTGEGGVMGLVQSPNKLYLNNCRGGFSDITESSGAVGAETSWSAAFGDINNDGYLDLFITSPGGLLTRQQHKNKLYLNNGDLTFTDISQSSGIDVAMGACVVGFSDYNRDGWTDIFVGNCNDIFFRPVPFNLFRNNGDLTFTDVAEDANLDIDGAWMGITFGDIDVDGDLDIFASNFGTSSPFPGRVAPHALFENNGDGTYTDIAESAGLAVWEFGWGTTFADFDNDGYPDMFYAGNLPAPPFNVIGPENGNPGRLFWNNGDRTFTMGVNLGLENRFTSGVASGDFDNDGSTDLVIVTGTHDEPGRPVLMRNIGNDNSWITVKTVGTTSNRDGVGARVRVETNEFTQVKEVRAGSSFLSMDSPWLTFGLGAAQSVDVEVTWPSGLVERFDSRPVNQTLTIIEGDGAPATCNGLPVTIVGTEMADTLVGTQGDDVILALAGNDRVFALGGDDTICAGDGNDVVAAGAGADTVLGESGNDIILGGTGNDTVIAGDGNDFIAGGAGNDVLSGDAGNDRILGGSGDDAITCGADFDIALGGPGSDTAAADCELQFGVP